MAETPMPGDVTLAFERQPNFFHGNAVLGPTCQTIICRDTSCDQIVGVATRSSRMLFVDGVPTRIGYLGGLRFATHVRGAGLLARGYRLLKQLHDSDDQPPEFYLTTIASSNESAKRILTSGRAGLPTYHQIGRFNTLVIPTRQRSRGNPNFDDQLGTKLKIESLAQQSSLDDWIDFLNRCGRQRCFFPVYNAADFSPHAETFRDLDLDSIVVVRKGTKIVATAGLWDQSAFRQTIVRGYSARMHLARPLLNLRSAITAGLRLPKVGDQVSALPVCLLTMDCDKPQLPKRLITLLTNRCTAENLMIGLSDGDPMLAGIAPISRLRYRTDLYAVNWDLDQTMMERYRNKPFYLELGCL